MIMPLLGLLDPSRGAFLWGAWGYTVTAQKRYGAQDRFCKRNTLSQRTLKQRICVVCAGRSDGT